MFDDVISVTNISKGDGSVFQKQQVREADCECINANKELMMSRSTFHKSMETLSNLSNGYSIIDVR